MLCSLLLTLILLFRITEDTYFRFGKRSQVQDFAEEGSRAVGKRDPSPDHVFLRYVIDNTITLKKYVVKHKSAKLLMTYAVGKLEAGTLMH